MVGRTDFNPDEESPGFSSVTLCDGLAIEGDDGAVCIFLFGVLGAANCVWNSCIGGSKDDGDGQEERHRGYVDHVAGDDTEVENLGVEPAHAIQGGHFFLDRSHGGGGLIIALGVDLLHASLAAVEHATLLRRLLSCGWGVRGGVADHGLEGDIIVGLHVVVV